MIGLPVTRHIASDGPAVAETLMRQKIFAALAILCACPEPSTDTDTDPSTETEPSSTTETTTTPTTETPTTTDLTTGEPAPRDRKVFVSATSVHTDDGIESADAACAKEAQEAGLDEVYLAWRSVSDLSASQRFEPIDGKVIMTNGEVVAESWADLLSGNLVEAPHRGAPPGHMDWWGRPVWTGTDPSGNTIPNGTCNDWSDSSRRAMGGIGLVGVIEKWTFNHLYTCRAWARVYCFSQ
ncbi:hypothetical protein OV079_23715 [Nannocystis pusilla]|uniref:DUF1554 domain-containing protein n=1 Tax=Nannocystis pusilla TaxID=889268 RepID=A0A9X3ERG1_9BACT|nr:hypothetical protein [Nannocystis pusilla]MCY1003984.1 hypothetical protein [Nannocystis pusilla]MCY1008510.1 hypothetical protein [Nannocystis pusilla]